MKKALKIIGIVLASLIGLVIVALLILSPVAKLYIQKHDKELIGRELTIEKLRINVLGGAVNIKGLVLYEDDDATTFLRLDSFKTKISLRDLLDRQVTVKEVLLSGLYANIQQNRTWFNFNSIIDHFQSSDQPKTEKKESSFNVLLKNIAVKESAIHYRNLLVGDDLLLNNIMINIPIYDFAAKNADIEANLFIGDTVSLMTLINLSNHGENYSVDLKLDNFGLGTLQPYLDRSLDIKNLKGRLDLDLQAIGNTDRMIDFDLSGNITLQDFSLCDAIGYQLGFIDSIYTDIKKFNMDQNELDIQKLYVSGIRGEYIIHPDKSTNFDIISGRTYNYSDTTFLEKLGDSIATEFNEVQKKKDFKVYIEHLRLDKSRFNYADHSLPSPFEYALTDITLGARDFAFDKENALRLRATLNQTGKLETIWSGDPNGLENHNLTLMLSNVKFSDFSPYSIQYFGYPLENGTLSFHSQNLITDGNLKGINKIQIADPSVGDKLKDYEPMFDKIPLKLGFYLLTDKDDKLHLDLPISGNLNDPEFSYFKAAVKVLGNILVKIATAPFRLLGFDGDNQYMEFDLLQYDFSAEEYSKLDEIATALSEKQHISAIFNQKVNFGEMIQKFSNLQLQRDYYLSIHPELDPRRIDFLTNEEIRSIKLNDEGLRAYAAGLGNDNKASNKKAVEAIALERYAEQSANLVNRFLERRNEQLLKYLTQIKGLAGDQIIINTPDEESKQTYNKKCRYEISVEM